jgi:hypothetical protein
MFYQWINQERTIISVTQDSGHIIIVEDGHPQWSEISARDDIAPYVEPEPIKPSAQTIAALRKAAYQDEADPLYFKAQREEATMDEWLAKIAEIKARYPEPDA